MPNFEFNGNQVRHDGRKIGWITKNMEGKRIFVSPRDRAKHYFRKFAGWGLNEDLLNWLEQEGFDEIHLKIHQRETLISSVAKWRRYSIRYHRPPYEPQVVLPEKYMEKKMLSLSEVAEGL